MLPALIERRFVVAPLVLDEPYDRELLVQQPLGRLLRPRADGVDHVQIELAPYTRPAFRLSAGVAPKEGVVGAFGPVAAEDVCPSWLKEFFEMTPGARVTTYFSVRRWPWQPAPIEPDYEQLVLRVVGLLPELEAALREGRLGPNTRRIASIGIQIFEGEGSMDNLRGTCPSLSFRVNGSDIVTHGWTRFSPDCSQLKGGDTVKVYGIVQRKGGVRATMVQKQ
jgi:hypothetical protein